GDSCELRDGKRAKMPVVVDSRRDCSLERIPASLFLSINFESQKNGNRSFPRVVLDRHGLPRADFSARARGPASVRGSSSQQHFATMSFAEKVMRLRENDATLTMLDLSWNGIGDEGAKEQGEALKNTALAKELAEALRMN